MKCPSCGFEHDEKISNDQILCRAWAYKFAEDKTLPTKKQYEAMQREKFLPTHGEIDGRVFEMHYSDCGWAADHNWPSIAATIAYSA